MENLQLFRGKTKKIRLCRGFRRIINRRMEAGIRIVPSSERRYCRHRSVAILYIRLIAAVCINYPCFASESFNMMYHVAP